MTKAELYNTIINEVSDRVLSGNLSVDYSEEDKKIIEQCQLDLAHEYVEMLTCKDGHIKLVHEANMGIIENTLIHIENRYDYRWYKNMLYVIGDVVGTIGTAVIKSIVL